MLATPTFAIQHVGSHETESATISDRRRSRRKVCHTVAIAQSHRVADCLRRDNRMSDIPISPRLMVAFPDFCQINILEGAIGNDMCSGHKGM